MHIALVITLDKPLDLGNNFTYKHFCDSIHPNEIVELYESISCDDSEITLKGVGNYGEVLVNTCGSDLVDHIFDSYHNIEPSDDGNNYRYKLEVT